jgi:transcriptional regulator with XRE-family HTH domain
MGRATTLCLEVRNPQTTLPPWQAGTVDDDLDSVLIAVGPRLRALRRQRETTLANLSETTGISVSTLSRLESGQRRPTLELLLPLARAYGVQIDELVGAPPTGDPRVHLRPVTRNGMTLVPLTRRVGGVQAYKLIIPAARKPVTPEPKPMKATNGSMSSVDASDWYSAIKISCLARARLPSSTPTCRTGSPAPTAYPSRSSASSADRANAHTYARDPCHD